MITRNEYGFSIVEVMIAIVVLTIGLLGVAAMQTKAIQENVFSGGLTEQTTISEQWMEWMINFSNQNFKINTMNYIGYEKIAELDTDPQVGNYTKLEVPCSNTDSLKSQLKAWGLRPSTGEDFTDDQIPKISNDKYSVNWYVDANSPINNTTTVKIEATGYGRTSTLLFMLCPYM